VAEVHQQLLTTVGNTQIQVVEQSRIAFPRKRFQSKCGKHLRTCFPLFSVPVPVPDPVCQLVSASAEQTQQKQEQVDEVKVETRGAENGEF
jgi:hypothetical protein